MIILSSTRPGRAGGPVAEWVRERVEEDFVDLLKLNLPMLDEPNHPLLPFVRNHIIDGRFQPTESFETSLEALGRELGRRTSAMAPLRQVQSPEAKAQIVSAA